MTLYFLSVFVHFVLAIYEVLFSSGFSIIIYLVYCISIAEKEDRCWHKTLSIITGYMQTRKTRKTLTVLCWLKCNGFSHGNINVYLKCINAQEKCKYRFPLWILKLNISYNMFYFILFFLSPTFKIFEHTCTKMKTPNDLSYYIWATSIQVALC